VQIGTEQGGPVPDVKQMSARPGHLPVLESDREDFDLAGVHDPGDVRVVEHDWLIAGGVNQSALAVAEPKQEQLAVVGAGHKRSRTDERRSC
jgi:hypothetical protein